MPCEQDCLLRMLLNVVKEKRRRCREILVALDALIFSEPNKREQTRLKITHIISKRDRQTVKIARIREVLFQGCDLCCVDGVYYEFD